MTTAGNPVDSEALAAIADPSFTQRIGGGDLKRFSDVDASADPGFFIKFLDLQGELPTVRDVKSRMIQCLEVSEGDHILDLGCGTGGDVCAIAGLVGPTGRVVGVDSSEVMIREASRRATERALPVEFRVEDAHSLDLDDESFHACRAERTLMHVADPARGLSEMIRVAKPGGRIVIYEFDHDTWVINGSDKELTRRFVTVTCESVRSGHIGRQLLGLFRRAGLRDVAVEPHAICYPFELATQIFGGRLRAAEGAHRVDPTDVSRWWADLTKAEGTGSFLCAVTGFLVSGRKL